ncbi:hypothetical protein [Kiloniella antarctica]|uniref:Lipoprotein n=1 Tax=Kiloniella antarctica TaxID=1550907 RepID=A0ABW5BIP4_9PROT
MGYLRAGFVVAVFVLVFGCSGVFVEKEPVRVISAPQTTTYCYRSLANVDCYEQPVPGDERTLLIPTE